MLTGKCQKKSSDSYKVNSGHNQGENNSDNRIISRALWGHVDDLWPHDLFDEEQRKEEREVPKVDECDGEYEDIDAHEADYENTPGEENDGQDEDPVSEHQDEDYVNTERCNDQDQYDDIDIEYPARHPRKKHTQGNGLYFCPAGWQLKG